MPKGIEVVHVGPSVDADGRDDVQGGPGRTGITAYCAVGGEVGYHAGECYNLMRKRLQKVERSSHDLEVIVSREFLLQI